MTGPAAAATIGSLAALTVTVVVSHRRIRRWKQWGLAVFEQMDDALCDRLNIEPNLEGLA